MSTPRDLPISFKAEMVLATLARRKSMTRRLIVPQPTPQPARIEKMGTRFVPTSNSGKVGIFEPCYYTPRYADGDTLWGREVWRTEARYDHLKPSKLPDDAQIWYEADGPAPEWAGRYRGYRFLPRRFSRIFLKVTEVRAERLQQITEEDAKAEGVEIHDDYDDPARFTYRDYSIREEDNEGYHWFKTAVESFKTLWDSINAGREFPWSGDWWVWVISFRVVGVKGE